MSTMTAEPALPARPVESRDPNTGEVWRTFEATPRERVVTAVEAARRAQRRWREVPLRERAALVGRVRREVYERRDRLADVLQREVGKPRVEAVFEVLLAADTAAWVAAQAPRALRPERFASRQIATLRKTVEIRWEPFGVVGVISPWNYPLLLTSGSLFPALAAGNAVVLKPSEMAPSCGLALVDAVLAAGVPTDLVQCLPGDGAVGRALIEAGVDRVFFTGSEGTGRKVAAACGERLIPCSLELGGSDAAIVLEDADPVTAAAGIVWGRCSNAGQTCIAPKRVFAVGKVHEPLIAELSRAVSKLRVGGGDDRDVAPLIRPHQARALEDQRADALERGARVVARSEPRTPSTAGAAAEILVDVNDRMRVLREETFGPLLPVVRVATVEEAIEGANRSPFGLSASVWTRYRRRGIDVARRLEAGTVMVNDVVFEAAMVEVPHGGVKASGMGRMHGRIGLMEAAWPKAIVIDRFSRWPQAWWFPYGPRLLEGVSEFFHFRHGRGLLSRAWAGIRAVRLLYLGKR